MVESFVAFRVDAMAPGKETNSNLLASSAHNQETKSNSMNSKYNIVVWLSNLKLHTLQNWEI